MKVITEGHKYELDSFEGGLPQTIQFIEKVPVTEGSAELKTVNDGTTNEELLKVLIDRTKYLGGKFASRQNSIAITKLQEALMWFENRTQERKERGVEGKATL